MDGEIKIDKTENLIDRAIRRQEYLGIDKARTEEFSAMYLCKLFENEAKVEYLAKNELLDYIDKLYKTDVYIHKTIEMLLHKYREEAINCGNVRYYKYGHIQYLFEYHQFEFMFSLIKMMAYKAENLEKNLTNVVNNTPVRYVIADNGFIMNGDKK